MTQLFTLTDEALIDRLQCAAFEYFVQNINLRNGLVADTSRDNSPVSIAVVGFALSSYPVAVERGWMERADAVQRSLAALRFFRDSDQSGSPTATGFKGFYYHFLDIHTGARVWQSELSMIDTALLIAGVLTASMYFTADTPDETELRALADFLYLRVDWQWAQGDGGTIKQGWKPESGFLHYGWEGYSEAIVLYVLALGSPTHPIKDDCYTAWTATYQWENLYGRDYLYAGPLFVHQFSHAWIDLRGIRDSFMREKDFDYFENSRNAVSIQRRYTQLNPHEFVGYDENGWGLSACDGPTDEQPGVYNEERRLFGYAARGVPYGPDDGTLSPSAVLGSLPFAPEQVLEAMRNMLTRYPQMLTNDRLSSSFNPTVGASSEHPWVSPGHYGLDQGIVLMMIENHRSQLIWQLTRGCRYISDGLQSAGFEGGWLQQYHSGGSTLMSSFDASIPTPQGVYEDKRLADLHPQAWVNPTPADCYALIIVGAGSAGIAAAELAIAMGVKVAMIERHLIGGTCLNTGCVPSKALIRTARLYAEMRDAARYGAKVPGNIDVDFSAAMERVRRIRSHLSGASSVRRLAALGVDMFFGNVRFAGSDTLMVNDQKLRFSKAMIATGTRPHVPTIPGLREAGFLTNANVFNLTELPQRLLVIGGGPVGCELAQAFRHLGANVTIVQDKPLFLEKEERDAAQILSDAFARDGIEVRLNTQVTAVRVENGRKLVDLISADYHSTIEVDAILTGVGRAPNVQGLDLEAAGVKYDVTDGIAVDDFLRTSNPRIYAAGDVCLEEQYTDTAAASARIVVHNALMRGGKRLSKLVIPWCTYTDPEISHVGMYVREANRKGIPVKTFTVPMHQIDRAVTDSEEIGFVKIHIRDGTDTILGATIVARHAGEMINEITLAMVAGIGLRTLAKVIHAYPTQAEAIREAAKAYVRTRVTQRLRARLQRWLAR